MKGKRKEGVKTKKEKKGEEKGGGKSEKSIKGKNYDKT